MKNPKIDKSVLEEISQSTVLNRSNFTASQTASTILSNEILRNYENTSNQNSLDISQSASLHHSNFTANLPTSTAASTNKNRANITNRNHSHMSQSAALDRSKLSFNQTTTSTTASTNEDCVNVTNQNRSSSMTSMGNISDDILGFAKKDLSLSSLESDILSSGVTGNKGAAILECAKEFSKENNKSMENMEKSLCSSTVDVKKRKSDEPLESMCICFLEFNLKIFLTV